MTVTTLDRATVAKLTKISDAEGSPYWDDTLRGFGLRLHVDANQKLLRSFVIQYRFGNRQRKISLGDAAKITVKQARDMAKERFAKIALGVDPAAEKEEARRVSTALLFRDGVAQYLDMQEKRLRPASFKNCKLYLSRPQYFSALHSMPVNEITRSHVSTAIDKIASRGTTVTASRCRAWLSGFFVWCLERGHAESNPVIDSATVTASPPRDRVLSDAELKAVWHACDVNTDFGRIVRLLILSGCRRGEIGGLRWSEIDMDAGAITIPGTRTKNKRAHTLPITDAMRKIIESVPRRVDRECLFGETAAVGFTGWKDKGEFDSGVKDQWTLHDLRRTVATGMIKLGTAPNVVEATLNHFSGHRSGVAGVYNRHDYGSEKRTALALWGDHVAAVVGGSPRKVVSFKRTA
jgi:integrase